MNDKEFKEFEDILKQIKESNKYIWANLRQENLGDYEAKLLAEALEKANADHTIYLSSDILDNEGFKYLLEAAHNTFMRHNINL